MNLGKWQFSPHFWPTLGAVIFMAGFGWLANWQFHRAGEKRVLIQQIKAGVKAPPANLNALVQGSKVAELARYRHVVLHGRYDDKHQILANQITHNSRLGYYVLTPFHLAGTNAWVIVNRGWVPNTDKAVSDPNLAIPKGQQVVTGLWTHLPRPGIRLGSGIHFPAGWPKKLLYPTRQQLASVLDHPVLAKSVWLSPDAKNGFIRDWHPRPRFGPKRHIGYAFQWIGLAATVFIVWVALNLHKRDKRVQA